MTAIEGTSSPGGARGGGLDVDELALREGANYGLAGAGVACTLPKVAPCPMASGVSQER